MTYQIKNTSGYIRHEKLNFVYKKIKFYTLFHLGKSGDSGMVETGGDCDGVGQAHSQYCTLARPLSQGFPGGSAGTEPACGAGDMGSTPGLVGSPGEGNHS